MCGTALSGGSVEFAMSRFHLNLFMDREIQDDEGVEHATLQDAKIHVIRAIRSLIAADIQAGVPILLSHRVEITDEAGCVLDEVLSSAAFEVRP